MQLSDERGSDANLVAGPPLFGTLPCFRVEASSLLDAGVTSLPLLHLHPEIEPVIASSHWQRYRRRFMVL